MENKNIGIWMDHHNANIIELNESGIQIIKIESEFTHQQKEHSLNKNENLMHNKENHLQQSFYKKIGDMIKNYSHVIIFGPTSAKSELLNVLRSDHHFDKIKIEISSSDKMTENQQRAFVKEYFLKK